MWGITSAKLRVRGAAERTACELQTRNFPPIDWGWSTRNDARVALTAPATTAEHLPWLPKLSQDQWFSTGPRSCHGRSYGCCPCFEHDRCARSLYRPCPGCRHSRQLYARDALRRAARRLHPGVAPTLGWTLGGPVQFGDPDRHPDQRQPERWKGRQAGLRTSSGPALAADQTQPRRENINNSP